MNSETTLTYSEPLIRDAVFLFWRRSIGVRFFVAFLLTSSSLALLLAQGETSWIVGVLGTVLALGVLFVIAIYVVHYRNALAKLRDMGHPSATLSLNEGSFTLRSGAGSATLPWSAVKELWQSPSVWLLLYSKAHFSTLPVACLSDEVQALILHRIKTAGGKIVS